MTLPEASSSDDMQDYNKALREPNMKSQTKKEQKKHQASLYQIQAQLIQSVNQNHISQWRGKLLLESRKVEKTWVHQEESGVAKSIRGRLIQMNQADMWSGNGGIGLHFSSSEHISGLAPSHAAFLKHWLLSDTISLLLVRIFISLSVHNNFICDGLMNLQLKSFARYL